MVSIKVENLVIKYKSLNSTSIQRNFFQKRKKRYTYTAVDDISFEVEKGEIFGLAGRNGSGKLTEILLPLKCCDHIQFLGLLR